MEQLSTLLFLGLTVPLHAQYCPPTFPSGYYNWQNKQIPVGDIDWALGVDDRLTSDYTAQSTSMPTGVPVQMIVTSGVWTGCAVWIDLDNDGSFADSENLYTAYAGGDPDYTYSFCIIIPASAANGAHRMRVIAGWGSDGTSAGTNGYGPCGAYQYGNFMDFTVVLGPVGIDEAAGTSPFTLGPNPTDGPLTLSLGNDRQVDRIQVSTLDGRAVKSIPVADKVPIDVGDLPAGAYALTAASAHSFRTVRVPKH